VIADSRSVGVRWALLAAVLFGTSTPLAKHLLTTSEPQVLAGLLYLGSGLGLGLFWLFRWRGRGDAVEAPVARHDLPWLAGAIIFGGVLAPVLLLTGLARTPASTASLLLNLEGVFTALLAWIVFRENVDRRIFIGMAAIVAGGAMLAWPGHLTLAGATGPVLVAAACLAWAIDNNLTQRVSAGDPVQIAGLKGLSAGAVNLGLGLALGGNVPAGARLGSALALGFVAHRRLLLARPVRWRRSGARRVPGARHAALSARCRVDGSGALVAPYGAS
jgi:drug/metabolite transporter (DMT)-like permease